MSVSTSDINDFFNSFNLEEDLLNITNQPTDLQNDQPCSSIFVQPPEEDFLSLTNQPTNQQNDQPCSLRFIQPL